jgi:hypothetical protein
MKRNTLRRVSIFIEAAARLPLLKRAAAVYAIKVYRAEALLPAVNPTKELQENGWSQPLPYTDTGIFLCVVSIMLRPLRRRAGGMTKPLLPAAAAGHNLARFYPVMAFRPFGG